MALRPSLAALVTVLALAPGALWAQPSGALPAFPGAEGGGALAVGGRGGAVLEVTTLADSGPGSLRAALETPGPRIVVFRVGGTIELESTILVVDPFLTVAGQTAPGGGVLLSGVLIDGPPLLVYTHDVVLRYLRIRTGRGASYVYGNGDVVSLGEGGDVYNVVLDHCSLSWGNDENVALWADSGTARNVTFQNNIISEALRHDDHSAGLIVGSNTMCEQMTDVDVVRNLFAHNNNRNPYTKVARQRVVNNVVYNWGWLATQIAGGVEVDIVANHYRSGPDDDGRSEVAWRTEDVWDTCNLGPDRDPSIHLQGNTGPHQADPNGEQWTTMMEQVGGGNGWGWPGSPPQLTRVPPSYERLAPLPAGGVPITVIPVEQLAAELLPTVGASRRLDALGRWVPNRDAVDLRVIEEVETGTGRHRLDEDDAGGYPTIAPGTPYADVDADGMADAWETANGFDPSDASDGPLDADGDGYTNVEEFLNGAPAVPASPPDPDRPPRLILFQQPTFPTTYPASVAENLAYIESLPADGIVISALPTWNVMDPEWTWTAAEIASELAPVANAFETVTENFFVVVNYDPGDVFDDAAWANAVGNWAAVAQAAREAGFAGLVFDTEEYATPWLNFPEDYDAPSASLAQYRMQTRLRGRQIAQAITAAWPDAELLVTYGAWLAEPDTPDAFRALQAGSADEYELLGPLFVGLVQGAGPQMTVIDGGEQYQIRTDAEFDAFYDWRETGIASDATNSAFIPPPLRAVWGDRVSTGFGIYNQSFNEDVGGSPMTPAIATATLRRALDRADDVVWLYSEQYQDGVGEWYVEGGMPSEWVEAVAAARETVAGEGVRTPSPAHHPGDKSLIHFGWSTPSATFLVEEPQAFENVPFDGVAFHLGTGRWLEAISYPGVYDQPLLAFAGRPWTAEEIGLDRLDEITWPGVSESYIVQMGQSFQTLDWYDDAHWDVVTANARLVSQAVAASGARGILFDPEYYDFADVNPWRYFPWAYPDRSFQEVEAQVRQRGAEYVEALQHARPEMEVVSLWWMSVVYAQAQENGSLEGSGYEFMRAFLNGMLDGAAPGLTLVDGNEGTYTIDESWLVSNNYDTVRYQATSLLDSVHQPTWQAQHQTAYAVYADYPLGLDPEYDWGHPADYQLDWFEHNVYHALLTTDRVAWLYDEEINWYHEPGRGWPRYVPPGAAQRIARARRKLDRGARLGFDLAKPGESWYDPAVQADRVAEPLAQVDLPDGLAVGQPFTVRVRVDEASSADVFVNGAYVGQATEAPFEVEVAAVPEGGMTVWARLQTGPYQHVTTPPVTWGAAPSAFAALRPTAAAVAPAAEVALRLSSENPTRGPARLALDAPPGTAGRLDVVDVLGRRVATLWDGPLDGAPSVTVDTAALAPGLYTARLSVGDVVRSVRFTVVR